MEVKDPLTLSDFKSTPYTTNMESGHKVGVFMFNASLSSVGTITSASAVLGKSVQEGKIQWFVQSDAWFDGKKADKVHASMRDFSIKLAQYHDGTPGTCDKQETGFCKYSLIYSTACPAGSAGCKPIEIVCKIPVEYLPKAANSNPQDGTLSVRMDYTTGKATDGSLTIAGGEIPQSMGGTITPKVWEMPVSVTDFEQAKSLVKQQVSLDWSRKVETRLGQAVAGNTYLALLATDHLAEQAHLIHSSPAPWDDGTGVTIPGWNPTCADDGNKVKITGSMSFVAAGVSKDQVKTASKEALSFALDVNQDLIMITNVTQASAQGRRLSDSWTVNYELEVAEAKAAAVEKATTAIHDDSSAFAEHLESSLGVLPGSITGFTIVKPAEKPQQNIEAVVSYAATSQWVSSAVAVVVAFAGTI